MTPLRKTRLHIWKRLCVTGMIDMKQFGKYIVVGVDLKTFGVGAYGAGRRFYVFVGPFYLALSFKEVV